MDIKQKATTNKFILFFVVIFLAILFGAFMVVIFPLMLLSFFSVSKFLFGLIFLGITIIATLVAMFVVKREYDISELSAFKTSLKLVGTIGFLPLIAYGPLFVLQHDFKGSFQVIVWLLIIGLVVYLKLKLSNFRKTGV